MLGVSGMPVSGAVGKLGDLGDRLGDKDKNSNLSGLGSRLYVSFYGWLVMPSRFRTMLPFHYCTFQSYPASPYI